MTSREFTEHVQALLELDDGYDDELVDCAWTFAESGVMTQNDGLVVRMSDGSEFQVTIVQSKGGPA